MNPETNRFEPLIEKEIEKLTQLIRPNGEPIPSHWTQFRLEELVEIKGYTFKVKYIGETAILFEPVGPIVIAK